MTKSAQYKEPTIALILVRIVKLVLLNSILKQSALCNNSQYLNVNIQRKLINQMFINSYKLCMTVSQIHDNCHTEASKDVVTRYKK